MSTLLSITSNVICIASLLWCLQQSTKPLRAGMSTRSLRLRTEALAENYAKSIALIDQIKRRQHP